MKNKKQNMKGAELGRMLEAARMSRRELATELGVADSTVGRWIKGEIKIGPVESLGLATYFALRRDVATTWSPGFDFKRKNR